jgi:hypothetical protein
MPPLPTIADTFRCAFEWASTDVGHAVNVMHFRKSGATAADLATSIKAHASANMWLGVADSAAIGLLRITPLDGASPTVDFSTASVAAAFEGQQGTQAVPAVAGVVKLITGTRGRSYAGRVFLPFLAEGSIVAGSQGSGVVSGAQAAWSAFHADMITAGWELVVASYKLSLATAVTAILYEAPCATQRRRQTRLR